MARFLGGWSVGVTKNFELRPDILVHFPKSSNRKPITVGVEIEKTKKIRRRLFHKLRKLVKTTQLSGVIYLCASDTIADAVASTFREVKPNAIRIRHYDSLFLLFGEITPPVKDTLPKLFNVEMEKVSIEDWLRFLSPSQTTPHEPSSIQGPS